MFIVYECLSFEVLFSFETSILGMIRVWWCLVSAGLNYADPQLLISSRENGIGSRDELLFYLGCVTWKTKPTVSLPRIKTIVKI